MKFQNRLKYLGNLTFLALVIFSTSTAFSQDSESIAFSYTFKPLVDNTATSIKNQCRTGTCWSYSTSSFLESEAARISGNIVDLSEMATVRYTYPLKAQMYLRMQGKYQFGPGSLAHDVLNAAAGWGLAPQEAYTGLQEGETVHNHGDMDAALLATMETLVKKPSGKLDPRWRETVEGILDTYLGELPTSFDFEGKSYTPKSFRDFLGIDPEAYINITSFTHHPFGKSFILEVPDNFSRGEFFNVPIDDLQRAVEAALEAGFTVAWDADVSEQGFSFRNGMALWPAEGEESKLWKEEITEANVTQESRQKGFDNQTTTDDHLMHIVGLATDQSGAKYFVIKNSWGQGNKYGGRQYISMPYFRAKTIAILVHRDAVKRVLR
ncbi:MAG: aminopeptidase [Bacteroidetes bacterium]|nr:MAG: aminopeptidase [Bacteroidota bacterium]